jgi:hypothetical protein
MILSAVLKGIREPQNTQPLKLRFSATLCGRRPLRPRFLRRTLKLEAKPWIWRPTYLHQPASEPSASIRNQPRA